MKDYDALLAAAIDRIVGGKLLQEFDTAETRSSIAKAIIEANSEISAMMVKDIFGDNAEAG